MFCPKCGVQLRDGARFCTSCGNVVGFAEAMEVSPDSPPPSPVDQAPPARRSRLALLITLGVLGVLLFGGLGTWALYEQGFFDHSQSSSEIAPQAISDETTSPASDSGSSVTAITADDPPTGVASDITSARSGISASKTKKGYPTSNLLDNAFDTAWAEGVKRGYGEGQTITFEFPSEVWVQGIKVVPGYAKYDAKADVDRWYSNGRVSTAQMVFSDGTKSNVFTLDTDTKDWQEMLMPKPVKTSRVTFVIVSTAHANTGTDHDSDDTSIAEMRVLGFDQ